MTNSWLTFTAKLDKVDINPCVAVPQKIARVFEVRGYIPVELDLLGTLFLANLVPLGSGNYRLYINGPMLKSTGWKVGDLITIRLRYDPKPRMEPVPQALALAFKEHPKAQRKFDTLTPSRRKEISRYINNLKSQEAIVRNVTKVVAALENKGTHITVR